VVPLQYSAEKAEGADAAEGRPAIRDTLIWFGALGLCGGLGAHFWGS
jgi:hypothetical protein